MTDKKVEIRVVDTVEDLIKHWDKLTSVPFIGFTPQQILVACLTDKAVMLEGKLDGEVVGISVVERKQHTLHILATYCPNHTRDFTQGFFQWAKSFGITKLSMMYAGLRAPYERLLGCKYITGIYEKDL